MPAEKQTITRQNDTPPEYPKSWPVSDEAERKRLEKELAKPISNNLTNGSIHWRDKDGKDVRVISANQRRLVKLTPHYMPADSFNPDRPLACRVNINNVEIKVMPNTWVGLPVAAIEVYKRTFNKVTGGIEPNPLYTGDNLEPAQKPYFKPDLQYKIEVWEEPEWPA